MRLHLRSLSVSQRALWDEQKRGRKTVYKRCEKGQLPHEAGAQSHGPHYRGGSRAVEQGENMRRYIDLLTIASVVLLLGLGVQPGQGYLEPNPK